MRRDDVAFGAMDVVDRYLTLGLRLGRHVDGLVDSYCGPPELQEAVAAEGLVAPGELAGAAGALAEDVERSDLEPQRKGWLGDQIRGVEVYARVLAGDSLSYSDEVEGCYGVRPQLGSEESYAESHELLDEL